MSNVKNIKIKEIIRNIYIPSVDSHKGQNGRLLIIGGSHLFHAASLWALKVASRIVDLVHYSSIEENNKIVQQLKEEFRDGIVVPRAEIENYIEEDDCILIGPGMVRSEPAEIRNSKFEIRNLTELEQKRNEGLQTYALTKYLLTKYKKKKWVIDAGALQMMEPEWIPEDAILTPHHKEFELLKSKIPASAKASASAKATADRSAGRQKEEIKYIAEKYKCVILLKGKEDIVASKNRIEEISGGNAGMTKGGTGDVLAGLIAALYCNNDAFTSAITGSYFNKKAGEDLYEKSGLWFNASDLADQIPQTMKRLFKGRLAKDPMRLAGVLKLSVKKEDTFRRKDMYDQYLKRKKDF